jgi:hypothetical protein
MADPAPMSVITATDIAIVGLTELGLDVRPGAAGSGSLVAYYNPTGWLPVVITLIPPTRRQDAMGHVRCDRGHLTADQLRTVAAAVLVIAAWRERMEPHDPRPEPEQGAML